MREYLVLKLEGDHYAMGRQHGLQVKRLRPLIAEIIKARSDRIQQEGPDARLETLVLETGELLRKVDAPLLDMIRGQAEALEFEFDSLLRYDLVTYLQDDLTIRRHRDDGGCTTWAAAGSATVDGEPILVKNRDNLPELLPIQTVTYATPESGYRYVYSGSAGRPGVSCSGINEAGLAVADTHVCSIDLGPGLPDYSLMMHLLEEHDSVSSAVDYLRSVPRLGRNNLLLADAKGHLAVFEVGHCDYGLLEAHDGILVNTNHFVSSEMKDCFVDVNPPKLRGSSLRRFEKVTSELSVALGRVDVPFAKRLMATHAGPLDSICRHRELGGSSITLSTDIFLPAERKMLFRHGLPCQGNYDSFELWEGR